MSLTQFHAPRRRRLPNGYYLRVVDDAPTRGEGAARLTLIIKTIAAGLLAPLIVCAAFAVVFWLKAAMGYDVASVGSPLRDWIDNLRATELL